MVDVLNYDNYVAGSWISAEQYIANINPSDTSHIVGNYAVGTVEDINRALTAARQAQTGWASAGIQARSNVLSSAARLMEDRAEELGNLLAREEGKQLGEATAEVRRAVQILDFFAAEALRNTGTIVDSVRPGMLVEMT